MTNETKPVSSMTEPTLEAEGAEPVAYVDPTERWRWLHVILSIPKVGDFLSFCIGVAPFALVLILLMEFGVDTDGEIGLGWAVLIALAPTYFWLRLLERGAGLRLLLPIPVINIPIKWILPILAAFALSMILGLG